MQRPEEGVRSLELEWHTVEPPGCAGIKRGSSGGAASARNTAPSPQPLGLQSRGKREPQVRKCPHQIGQRGSFQWLMPESPSHGGCHRPGLVVLEFVRKQATQATRSKPASGTPELRHSLSVCSHLQASALSSCPDLPGLPAVSQSEPLLP